MNRGHAYYIWFFAIAFFSLTNAQAQDAKLLEAAKKEGKVVIYGSLESDTVEAVKQPFQKKYGIEVEYWRASATKVMDRALSESRAGKPMADLILTNDNPMRVMQQQGFFQKYVSPTASDFPKEAVDPALGARVVRDRARARHRCATDGAAPGAARARGSGFPPRPRA